MLPNLIALALICAEIYAFIPTNRQADEQTDRQTGEQTNRQTGEQTDELTIISGIL